MSTSNVENLAPVAIKKVTKELTELNKEPLEGIHLLPNEDDVSSIQAIIEGPISTPYYGGRFKVKLVLDKAFPVSPPKGYFLTKIFHPNVARNGEICVSTLKKDWKEDMGIKHLFLVIKCLLIVPNPESALNEDAGKLLLENYDEYFDRAKMMTEIHAKGPIKELECLMPGPTDEQQRNPRSSNRAATGGALQSSTTVNQKSFEGEFKKLAAKKQQVKPSAGEPIKASIQKSSSVITKNKKKSLKRL